MNKLILTILVLNASILAVNASTLNDSTLIVHIAKQQIGKGESDGDNKGKEIREFTDGQEVPWCAGFVSYVLKRAGKNGYFYLSARKFWNLKANRVSEPKEGDIICFWRKSKDSVFGHVGIVTKVSETEIETVQGNVGKFPAKVKVIKYQRNNIPKLLGYVRI